MSLRNRVLPAYSMVSWLLALDALHMAVVRMSGEVQFPFVI